MSDEKKVLYRTNYPRPDFIRKNFQTLNGKWEFAFPNELVHPFPEGYNSVSLPREILVPFCYQSSAENRIFLRAEDDLNCDRPRGKQYWKQEPERCWHTNTTGIWKSVWLEFVPIQYIDHVKLTPDIDRRALELKIFLSDTISDDIQAVVAYQGKTKTSVNF